MRHYSSFGGSGYLAGETTALSLPGSGVVRAVGNSSAAFVLAWDAAGDISWSSFIDEAAKEGAVLLADEESGLHYNVHRYYDASTGRYLQSDRIGLAGGENTYLYASASPLISYDLSGLLTFLGAWLHYIGGSGDKLYVPFAEADPGLEPRDFEGYNIKVNDAIGSLLRNITIEIDIREARDAKGYVFGAVTFRLKGKLKLRECDWKFSGYIGAFDDLFDFDAQDPPRTFPKEALTTMARRTGKLLDAKAYYIGFRGRKSVSDGGSL